MKNQENLKKRKFSLSELCVEYQQEDDSEQLNKKIYQELQSYYPALLLNENLTQEEYKTEDEPTKQLHNQPTPHHERDINKL